MTRGLHRRQDSLSLLASGLGLSKLDAHVHVFVHINDSPCLVLKLIFGFHTEVKIE